MNLNSSLFHPMRYARTRPFAKALAQRSAGQRAPNVHVEDVTDAIGGHLARAMPFLGERTPAAPTLVLAREVWLADSFAAFTAGGRNVFALSPPLVELLAGTDLGDVRLGDLHLPYDSFYVGFGDAMSVAFPGERNRIDGAYIDCFSNGLRIRITSRRLDVPEQARASWVSHSEAMYKVFLESGSDQPIGELLDRSIEDDAEIALSWAARARAVRDAFMEPFAADDPLAWTSAFIDELREGRPVAKQVLSIILNALCYLASTAGEEDLRSSTPVLPGDAPEHVARGTRSGRASHRSAAERRLAAGGYVPVRILGRRVRPLARTEGGVAGRSVSPHWRRGHSRRQAYGPGRQLHRIIRVPPTLVRADLGEPAHGHVYAVAP